MRMGYGPLVGVVVLVGLVIGIVFGGGYVVGRSSAGTPTPAAAAAGGGGGGGGGGAGAAGGQGGTGAAGAQGGGGQANLLAGQTIGFIDSVQGDAVALRGLDGATTQLATTASSVIANSVPGSLADLRSGALIAVSTGPPDARGRTTARSIVILPPQLAGGAGASPRPSGTPPR